MSEEEIELKNEYFTDISNIPAIVEELGKAEGNFELFKVIEYWCDHKFSELAEAEQVEPIRALLFQNLIENYSKIQQNFVWNFARAQAAFYINVYDSWGEFFPWVLTLPQAVTLFFLLAFSRKINERGPEFLEHTNTLKANFLGSEHLSQIIEFLNQNLAAASSAVFSIHAALSTWIDTSFVYSEEFVQIMQANLSNAETYGYILTLAQNTIIHAPEEQQPTLLNEMLPLDLLSRTAVEIESTKQPQVAFADYLFFLYKYFFNNEELRNYLTEYAGSMIEAMPQAGVLFLNILAEAASRPEFAATVLPIAWQVLVSLTSAEDASIVTVSELQRNANYALKVISQAGISDPESTAPILKEIFSSIDLSETGTFLAQIILYDSIIKSKKIRSLQEDEASIMSGFMQIVNASPQEVAADQHATLIFYFLCDIAINATLVVLNYSTQLAKFFYEFITESEAPEEVLSVLDSVYPKFLNCFGRNYPIPPEGIVRLVDNFTGDRLHSCAILITTSEDSEANAEIITQVVEALHGAEAEPEKISSALLLFISSIVSETNQEYTVPLLMPLLEECQQYVENDNVAGLYISAFNKLTDKNEEENFFTSFEDFVGIANGPEALYAIFDCLSTHARSRTEAFIEAANAGFPVLIDKLISNLEQIQYGMRDQDSMLKVLTKFEVLVSMCNDQLLQLSPEINGLILEKFIPLLQRFNSFPNVFISLLHVTFTIAIKMQAGVSESLVNGISFVFSPEYDYTEKIYYFIEEDYMRFLKRFDKISHEQFIEGTNAVLELTKMQDSPDFFTKFIECNIKNTQVRAYSSPFFSEVWRRLK